MSRPLSLALLVSIAVHGLAAASWHVPREPATTLVLTASLRLASPPAESVAQVAAASPRPWADASRPRPMATDKPAATPVVAPAAFISSAAPVEATAASPVVVTGPVPGPTVAPMPSAPLEPPRFAAAYLANPPPPYPISAKRRGVEGEVRVDARIGVSGQAQEVKLAASAGDTALDEAAIEAVRHWRFEPARRGSLAVEAWVSIPVVFRLN